MQELTIQDVDLRLVWYRAKEKRREEYLNSLLKIGIEY